MAEQEYDEEREDYASLADEMNDPDVGPWNEDDWEPRAVANGKSFAAKHGLSWPPQTGDYDRYWDRINNDDDDDPTFAQPKRPT